MVTAQAEVGAMVAEAEKKLAKCKASAAKVPGMLPSVFWDVSCWLTLLNFTATQQVPGVLQMLQGIIP